MGLRGTVNIWVTTTMAGAVSVLAWLYLDRRLGPERERSDVLAGFGWGAVVGLGMAVATWVLYPLAADIYPPLAVEVSGLYGVLRQPPGPLLALPLLILVVAAEELAWRGMAIDIFERRMSSTMAVVVSSLTYTLPQFAMRSWVLIVVAFGCGLVWGALRVRTKGLSAPLAAHLTWNVGVFIVHPVA